MVFKPGRLHRKLSPNGTPLFKAQISSVLTVQDPNIRSISISHGKSGPEGGITPATLEIEVNTSTGVSFNRAIKVTLADWVATQIASYNPNVTAAQIKDRFTGRVGAVSVSDRGDRLGQHTTVQGSSWSALLRVSRRLVPFVTNRQIRYQIEDFILDPALTSKGLISLNFPYDTVFDSISVTREPATFSEAIDDYTTTVGIQVPQHRNGSLSIEPITRRRTVLETSVQSHYPILRSEAISPAQWAQPLDYAAAQLILESDAGDITWQLPSGVETGVVLEEQRIDWTHILRSTDNYVHFMTARNLTTNAPIMGLESITVDIIHLLSSNRAYDRYVAAQILALEEGDPVYLSGDWPALIAAPYLAQGIEERIDQNTWTIKLNLQHARNVLGYQDSEVPYVPPRVWNQARLAWNDETATWDER